LLPAQEDRSARQLRTVGMSCWVLATDAALLAAIVIPCYRVGFRLSLASGRHALPCWGRSGAFDGVLGVETGLCVRLCVGERVRARGNGGMIVSGASDA
jgi:hypothetical protein